MPCFSNTPDRENLYLHNLGILQSVLEDLPSTTIFIIGDWNADVTSNLNSFGPLLNNFCRETSLTLSSHNWLPQDTYTYVSDAWDSTSWLDHCITTQDAHNSITDISVYYSLGAHDHIPFSVDISLSLIPVTHGDCNDLPVKIDWDRLTSRDIYNYTELTDNLLTHVPVPYDCISCLDPSCSDPNHTQSLSTFYNDIVSCLTHASESSFSQRRSANFQCRPGWSDYVADFYDAYRESFVYWSANGKPRHGHVYDELRTAKARFKYALRFIKKEEENLRCDAIARKFSSKNPKSFWKEIRKHTASRVPLPNCIDGVTGNENIGRLWRDHYDQIFNCLNTVRDKPVYDCNSESIESISPMDIEKAICSLQNNKACGLDNISAEHLKYSSRRIVVLLSMCFSSLLLHGFMPTDMISVVLIPLIKDKSAKITSLSNYRPIALASIMSKIIESVILDRIQDYIYTNPNQYGFKPNLGTEMPIYLIKEIIDRYRSLNGNVFVCFLDASKAFDRVNHDLLFSKLLRRGVPCYLVRFLDYWYSNQTICVRWGGVTSSTFKTSNGVRQGGILSPYLFNLYVDDLSNELNSCYTGCAIGNTIINHVMYADDLAVFSPCKESLTDLLKICENFGLSHDLLFNSKKSAIMIFKNCNLKRFADQQSYFYINDNVIPIVDKFKYLGHYISNDLKDNSDLLRQCGMLYAQGNLLRHRFYKCSTPVKVSLFKTFCYSLYTSPLWWNYTGAVFRKLRVAYNDAFRMLFSYPRFNRVSPYFVNLNVLTFEALLRFRIYSFKQRIEKCCNVLIRAICTSDLYWSSRIRCFWHHQLYVV
jgi:hypothetical protein